VHVFQWNGKKWEQLGSDIVVGEATGDQSGHSVSLSNDGSIVAIGAPINEADHICVFRWDVVIEDWEQVANIHGENAVDQSGSSSVSLPAGDGYILYFGYHWSTFEWWD
jgi:hypothetical protein